MGLDEMSESFYMRWNSHKTNCDQCCAVLNKNLLENRKFNDHTDEFCPDWAGEWFNWKMMEF